MIRVGLIQAAMIRVGGGCRHRRADRCPPLRAPAGTSPADRDPGRPPGRYPSQGAQVRLRAPALNPVGGAVFWSVAGRSIRVIPRRAASDHGPPTSRPPPRGTGREGAVCCFKGGAEGVGGGWKGGGGGSIPTPRPPACAQGARVRAAAPTCWYLNMPWRFTAASKAQNT